MRDFYLHRAARTGLDTLANSFVWRELAVVVREAAVEGRERAVEEVEAGLARQAVAAAGREAAVAAREMAVAIKEASLLIPLLVDSPFSFFFLISLLGPCFLVFSSLLGGPEKCKRFGANKRHENVSRVWGEQKSPEKYIRASWYKGRKIKLISKSLVGILG